MRYKLFSVIGKSENCAVWKDHEFIARKGSEELTTAGE
jgi:hypothetical protein